MKNIINSFFVIIVVLMSCSENEEENGIDCSGFSIEVSNHTSNYNAWVNQTGGIQPISYVWSNGETGLKIGGDEGTLEVGNYTVTVTDGEGCTLTGSISIEHQPAIIENNVECIGSNSAVIEVTVTDNGESEITEKGVCYSLSQNPTVNDTKTIFSEVYSSSVSIESLSLGTTYYARGYAINSAGVNYGEEMTFTTNAETSPFIIGQKYQGGIIAHINCDGTSGYILYEREFGTNSWIRTKEICEGGTFNDYNDWYLPKIRQLQQMYHNLHLTNIYTFRTGSRIYDNYWSSSDTYNSDACGDRDSYYFDFDNGDFEKLEVCYQLNFVAVRDF